MSADGDALARTRTALRKLCVGRMTAKTATGVVWSPRSECRLCHATWLTADLWERHRPDCLAGDPEKQPLLACSSEPSHAGSRPPSSSERDSIIEECAVKAEALDRVGREWVADSLWDKISRETAGRIRSLKSPPTVG